MTASCSACRHLKRPEFDKRGNLKRRAYECGLPAPAMPPLPDSIVKAGFRWPPSRIAVWPEDGAHCSTFEPREGDR